MRYNGTIMFSSLEKVIRSDCSAADIEITMIQPKQETLRLK